MKLILAASLITTLAALPPTPASAENPSTPVESPPPKAMPASACRQEGPILFASTGELNPRFGLVHVPLTAITLYDTGAWQLVETTDGKPTRLMSGCLANDQLATIRGDLRAAPWKTTPYKITCEAISATSVQYTSHGKWLWTEVMCGHTGLDEVSRKKLVEITTILADVSKRPAIETAPGKP